MNDNYQIFLAELKTYLDILNEDQRGIVLEYIIEMYHRSEDSYDNDGYITHDSSDDSE